VHVGIILKDNRIIHASAKVRIDKLDHFWNYNAEQKKYSHSLKIIKRIFKMKKKVVVLTGAGISAESGLKTFRDSNGLWEEYRIEDVASPEGWQRNKKLVLDFYNQRRRHCWSVNQPCSHCPGRIRTKIRCVHNYPER